MTQAHRQVCTVIQELRDFMELYLAKMEPPEFADDGEIVIAANAQHNRQRHHIFSLIEEIQTHVNVMEAGLYLQKDYNELKEECRELEKKIKRLEAKRKKKK